MRESPYFTRYASLKAPLVAVLSEIDGQPAVALYPEGPDHAEARAFVRVSVEGTGIVHVTDYTHCPWMIANAGDVSPIPARA